MAKQICFEYKGTEYTLEFTRKTRTQMEDRGFIAYEILDKPMNALPTLFAGAFLANHKFIKKALVDEMFDLFTCKQALVEKLGTIKEAVAKDEAAKMVEKLKEAGAEAVAE